MAGRIYNPSAAQAFIYAGNARVTLASAQTGARYTYRIKASDDGRVHFVALLNGPDNGASYGYIGYVRNGKFIHGGHKAKASEAAKSVVAFGWASSHIHRGKLPPELEVWHEGRCGRCGRTLTVPTSIETGLGPTCATRV